MTAKEPTAVGTGHAKGGRRKKEVMSRVSCPAATLVSSALVIPVTARASDFTLFQHGELRSGAWQRPGLRHGGQLRLPHVSSDLGTRSTTSATAKTRPVVSAPQTLRASPSRCAGGSELM